MNPPDLSKYPDDDDKKLVWLAWQMSQVYCEQIGKPAMREAVRRLREDGIPIVKIGADGVLEVSPIVMSGEHAPHALQVHLAQRVAEEMVARN